MVNHEEQLKLKDLEVQLVVIVPLYKPTKEDMAYWSKASGSYISTIFILVEDNPNCPLKSLVKWKSHPQYSRTYCSDNLMILDKKESRGILSSIMVAKNFLDEILEIRTKIRFLLFDQDTRWKGSLPINDLREMPEYIVGYPKLNKTHRLKSTPTFKLASYVFGIPWPQWSGISFSANYLNGVERSYVPCLYHSDLYFILNILPTEVTYYEYVLQSFDHVPSHEKPHKRFLPIKNHSSILHTSSSAYRLVISSIYILVYCHLKYKFFAMLVVISDIIRLFISLIYKPNGTIV